MAKTSQILFEINLVLFIIIIAYLYLLNLSDIQGMEVALLILTLPYFDAKNIDMRTMLESIAIHIV